MLLSHVPAARSTAAASCEARVVLLLGKFCAKVGASTAVALAITACSPASSYSCHDAYGAIGGHMGARSWHGVGQRLPLCWYCRYDGTLSTRVRGYFSATDPGCKQPMMCMCAADCITSQHSGRDFCPHRELCIHVISISVLELNTAPLSGHTLGICVIEGRVAVHQRPDAL